MTIAPTPTPLDVLVDAAWLDEHLDDSAVAVVEVDVSPAAYTEGHIVNAVLWDVYRDLKDADYRLVDRADLRELLERSGITPDSTVVFYGYAPAMGVWLLELLGHRDARILDCSRDAWKRAGRAWTDAPATPAGSSYRLGIDSEGIRADRSAVESAMGDPARTILDVRSQAEYRGERFWPSGAMEPGGRAGHVPRARHLPVDGVLDEHGSFRNTAELRTIFSTVDLDTDDELITYCTIGGRAATAWFVLTHLLGRTNVRVYDASWAEWGRLHDTIVASPDQPEGRPAMTALVRMSLDAPEETRPFEHGAGQLQIVNLDAGAVGRATFQPGWKWSEHVKPIAKTDSCQAAHTCYFVSGRMMVVTDDGQEMEYGPGDFAIMAPGHDAWIVGDEPCVVIDWQGFADYAKP